MDRPSVLGGMGAAVTLSFDNVNSGADPVYVTLFKLTPYSKLGLADTVLYKTEVPPSLLIVTGEASNLK